MINKLKQRKESGFTIIEVMIVLAIAGLIMVVVFMAVPALQRSGRNNAIESSVNNALSAVADYSTNNGGKLPNEVAFDTNTKVLTISETPSTSESQEKVTLDTGISAVSIKTAAATAAITPTVSTGAGTVQIVTGTDAQCNSSRNGLETTAANKNASARSYVVLFVAESGGGTAGKVLRCIGN